MSAAILCPKVCVSDLMSKAGMVYKSMKHVTRQLFSLFVGKANQHSYTLGSSNLKKKKGKKLSLAYKLIELPNRAHTCKYLHIFSVSMPNCTFGSLPYIRPDITTMVDWA